MQDTVFDELADIALKGSGQSLSRAKAYLVEARLSALMRREGFASLADLVYCLKARQNPVLRAEVVSALLSKDTWFFRERSQLAFAVNWLLPQRAAACDTGRVRIWCAGGSTGQEAYSLAMLLADEPPPGLAGVRIDIVSTDLCKASTERARQGVYGHYEVQRGLSVFRMVKHFARLESGDWQVSEDLRGLVSFRVHNLLDSANGLGKFDLILCRNVMSGMARGARTRLADVLAAQMSAGAAIVLAEGETFIGLTERLEPAAGQSQLWVAAGTANHTASAA